MAKTRVPVAGTIGKSIQTGIAAAAAATITAADLAAIIVAVKNSIQQANPSGLTPTAWSLITEIPPNISKIAALIGNGFLVRNSDGTWSLVPQPVGIRGEDGPEGPQGEMGFPGLQGPKGDKGDRGSPGDDGTSGEDGAMGPPGPQGPAGTGAAGPQGPLGPPGFSGSDGEDGADGPPGPAGPFGPTGATGPQGPQGFNGNDGDDGEAGPPGLIGAQGPTGSIGLTGPQGVPGFSGADGSDGDMGNPGPIGPQGPLGVTGALGPQGIPGFAYDGEDGDRGPPGAKGDTSNSGTLVFSNTSVPAGNTVANTAVETTFASQYTIPAGLLQAGSVIRLQAFGVSSTAGIAPSIQLKLKMGSTTLLDSGAITPLLGGATNAGWYMSGYLVAQTVGGSGTIEAQGSARFQTGAATSAVVSLDNTAPFTIDTTVAQTLTLTLTWGTASAANTTTLRELMIWVDNVGGNIVVGPQGPVGPAGPVIAGDDSGGGDVWDPRPPMDPNAGYNWSSTNAFSGMPTPSNNASTVSIGATTSLPQIQYVQAGGGTNAKVWDNYIDTTTWHFRIINDARNAAVDFMSVVRSALSITGMNYGDTNTATTKHAFTGNVGVGTGAGFGKFAVVSTGGVIAGGSTWTDGYSIFGPNSASSTGAAIALGYDSTADSAFVLSAQPGTAWKNLFIGAADFTLKNNGNGVVAMACAAATGITFNIPVSTKYVFNLNGASIVEILNNTLNLSGASTSTISPAAGGAGALPATPVGYVQIAVGGTARRIPYYT